MDEVGILNSLRDAFHNVVNRVRDLESREQSPPLTNLAPNGGFDTWALGNGPFTTDGGNVTPAWVLEYVGAGAASVSRDSVNKDYGSVYDAALTFTDAPGNLARLQQTLAQAPLYAGRTLALSARVKFAGTARAWISTDAGATFTYGDPTALLGSVYETLTVVVEIPLTVAIGDILFGIEVSGASGVAYIDNVMLVSNEGAVEFVPLPEVSEGASFIGPIIILGDVTITGGSLFLTDLTPGSVLFIGASNQVAEDNANFFWDNTNKQLEIVGDISITSGDLFLADLTQGSVLFIGATNQVTEDNVNFFWDNANNRLGLGTNTPAKKLDILFTENSPNTPQVRITNAGTGNSSTFQVNATGGGNPNIGFAVSGTAKASWAWNIASNSMGLANLVYSVVDFSLKVNSDGSVTFHDAALTTERVRINPSGRVFLNIFTPGSVPFIGAAGEIKQNNARFFWDEANERLGIGDNTPNAIFHVDGSYLPPGFPPVILQRDSDVDALPDSAGTAIIRNLDTTLNNFSQITFSGADSTGAGLNAAAIKGIYTARGVGTITADISFLSLNGVGSGFDELMRLAAGGAATIPGTLTLGALSGVLKATAGLISDGVTTSDVPEGSNLYFTDARAQAAIDLTYPLAIANGGTGVGTFTTNGVVYGNGTTNLLVTAQGAANSVLTANAGAPAFSAAPTIGTSVTTPLIIGGAAVGSTLTLESTSAAGTTDNITFKTGSQVTAGQVGTLGTWGFGAGAAAPTATMFQISGSLSYTGLTGVGLFVRPLLTLTSADTSPNVFIARISTGSVTFSAAATGVTIYNLYMNPPTINNPGGATFGTTHMLYIFGPMSVGTLNYSVFVNSGTTRLLGRFNRNRGTTTAAANDLTLPADGNHFIISGNTQINAIASAGWEDGAVISLRFSGTPTVKHNTAGSAGFVLFSLAGSVDFAATASDTLTLVLDSSAWRELARTVI